MVRVKLENLRKEFPTPSGAEVAVEGTELTIEDGEFLTLVGPSGCGKSTTLRMIAGLETPTSGDIYFDDAKVTDLSPQDRDIAMVFQDITLYPHMTIAENMGYGLRVRGEMENYDEKIENIASVLGIEDMMDKKPGQLSGGQKQRVSLGRALVRDPNLILFDEPLSDLDANLKNELRVEIQRLHQEFETTMVYVTHDQEEALTMSDRIGVMNDGKMVQVSRPEKLFDSPRNQFIGQFIGQPTMNFLEGTSDEDGHIQIKGLDEKVIEIVDSDSLDIERGDIIIGMRPQHMSITDDPDTAFISAEYDVHEMIGTKHVAYLVADNGEEFRAVVDEPPTVERGEQVLIAKPSQVYLFDQSTGELVRKCDIEEFELAKKPLQ